MAVISQPSTHTKYDVYWWRTTFVIKGQGYEVTATPTSTPTPVVSQTGTRTKYDVYWWRTTLSLAVRATKWQPYSLMRSRRSNNIESLTYFTAFLHCGFLIDLQVKSPSYIDKWSMSPSGPASPVSRPVQSASPASQPTTWKPISQPSWRLQLRCQSCAARRLVSIWPGRLKSPVNCRNVHPITSIRNPYFPTRP